MFFALLFPLLSLAVEPLPAAPLPPAPAPSPPPPTPCQAAEKQLTLFAAGLRVTCAKDTDCVAHALSSDPCAPLSIVNKDAPGLDSAELKARLKKATAACSSEWAARAACKKPEVRAVCRDNRCIDGGQLPASVK